MVNCTEDDCAMNMYKGHPLLSTLCRWGEDEGCCVYIVYYPVWEVHGYVDSPIRTPLPASNDNRPPWHRGHSLKVTRKTNVTLHASRRFTCCMPEKSRDILQMDDFCSDLKDIDIHLFQFWNITILKRRKDLALHPSSNNMYWFYEWKGLWVFLIYLDYILDVLIISHQSIDFNNNNIPTSSPKMKVSPEQDINNSGTGRQADIPGQNTDYH